MSDLERELTSVLSQQAGPSGDPHAALAEHERRLAARAKVVRNRSVAGVMAVVAAVGVSSALLLNGPSEPSPPVATQPTGEETTAPATADPGVVDSVKLADFTADGKDWTAFVTTTDEYGSRCFIIVGVPAGGPPDTHGVEQYPAGQGCQEPVVHPGDPLIAQMAVLPATDTDPGPLPHLTVWATVPEVAEISVAGAAGNTFTATLLDTMDDVKVWVTSETIANAQGFTMRDANGKVLREDEY